MVVGPLGPVSMSDFCAVGVSYHLLWQNNLLSQPVRYVQGHDMHLPSQINVSEFVYKHTFKNECEKEFAPD